MKPGKLSAFRPDQEVVWLYGDVHADHEEWAAEQEAKRPNLAEGLEAAIRDALAAGVDGAEIRATLTRVFRGGEDDPFAALIAASRIGRLTEAARADREGA